MKTAYTFVTLRYVHDVVTGEFANVGLVVYAPEERYLEARFTSSYERLNALFVKIDHANYRNLIRYLGNRFVELAAEVREGLNLVPVQGIDQLVCAIEMELDAVPPPATGPENAVSGQSGLYQ